MAALIYCLVFYSFCCADIFVVTTVQLFQPTNNFQYYSDKQATLAGQVISCANIMPLTPLCFIGSRLADLLFKIAEIHEVLLSILFCPGKK